MTATAVEAPSASPEGALYVNPRGLYPFQLDHIAQALVARAEGRPYAMLAWDTGLGKAEPVSEPVLTPSGWSTMGDLRVGDQVVSADGRPAEVLQIHPQTDREVYRITFSDGSWTRCTKDHLWTVGYWGSDRSSGRQQRVRRSKTVTLRQLLDEGVQTPAGRRKFSIPMTAPVQYPECDLPMDPYILGVILGDGNVNQRGYVSLTTDKGILETIAPELPHSERRGCYILRTNTWSAALRGLGIAGCRSWEKFVPEPYLRAPEEHRRALLAGLIDTDGSPIEDGGVEFCSTSEALVDAVIELTESLGGQARSKTSRVTTYSYDGESRLGRESWRVNLKLDEQPFRLERKMVCWEKPTKYLVRRLIESIERVEDERSVCITVDRPDGLYLTRSHIVTHNSHAVMAISAFTIQDEAADVLLLVCERVKRKEWLADFKMFTTLEAQVHHGPTRRTKLAKGWPQVIISTYETLKSDLTRTEANKNGRGKHQVNGWLLDELIASGRRPMVIFDESDKLSSRSSGLYKGWDFVLRTLRKHHPQTPVYMATATPIRRDPENSFNQLRLLAPNAMPLVGEFEKYFVRKRDIFGRALYFDHRIPEFVDLCQPLLLVKSKEDADIREQFPAMTEEALWVDLEGSQRDLYDLVYEMDTPGALTALRQICAHPASLLHSAEHGDSKLAKMLVDELGAEYLRSVPSVKTARLVEYLRPIVLGQGAKAVVFSFFGPSVLPLLKTALEAKGITCWVHNEEDGIEAFRASPQPGVLLASDAASRGINLPEASYLVEYDVAPTFGVRTQRLNRISRIGKGGPTATVRTMLVRKSVEVGLLWAMLRGNAHSDALLGKGVTGEDCMTMSMRKRILTRGME